MSNVIALPTNEGALLRPPTFSDEALALRFADRHSDDLRYVAALGKWLQWTGERWQQDGTLIARHCARLICREASAECNKSKAGNAIASAKTVLAVERLAQADRRLAATLDQWDADTWLLNTPGHATATDAGGKARLLAKHRHRRSRD